MNEYDQLSARTLNPVWHRILYSCTQMATMGVKGLTWLGQMCLRWRRSVTRT